MPEASVERMREAPESGDSRKEHCTVTFKARADRVTAVRRIGQLTE